MAVSAERLMVAVGQDVTGTMALCLLLLTCNYFLYVSSACPWSDLNT